MENIRRSLLLLEDILIKIQSPVLSHLGNGLSREIIINSFRENMNIHPRDEVIQLYEWKNGVKFPSTTYKDEEIRLLFNGAFYNIDSIFEINRTCIEWEYYTADKEYIPIFGFWQDENYLIDNKTGAIILLAPGIQSMGEIIFKSLDQMIRCIIACYNEGVFSINETGFQLSSTDDFFDIASKYNTINNE